MLPETLLNIKNYSAMGDIICGLNDRECYRNIAARCV